MESEKQAQSNNRNSSTTTSSGPEHRPPPRKPSRKRAAKRKKLRTAETSDDEHPDEQSGKRMATARVDKHAAKFAPAGEWPVDTKEDSAGPPVRSDPSGGVDNGKKRDEKEKKRMKKRSEKRSSKKRDKEKLQPPSSDNTSKAPEKASKQESTTKRNLHLIKTERVGHGKSESSSDDKKETERRGKKRQEKERKRSNEKIKEEKREGDEAKKAVLKKKEEDRKKVERESIHMGKEKEQQRRKVEREAIPKPEGWRDVEREPLENYIPQYDNLPEDSLIRALKPPPSDPNSNPFTPRPDSKKPQETAATPAAPATTNNTLTSTQTISEPGEKKVVTLTSTQTISEPGEKKVVTEKEKKELHLSVGTELSEVSVKPRTPFKTQLKNCCKNPHWCVWIWIAVLIFMVVCLIGAFFVQLEEVKRLSKPTKTD